MSRIGPVGVHRSDAAWVEVRVTGPPFHTVPQLPMRYASPQVTDTLIDSVVSSVSAPFCTIPMLT